MDYITFEEFDDALDDLRTGSHNPGSALISEAQQLFVV